MSEHPIHVMVRHADVAIIGGSAAGLAAALQLGRQRRSVIVVDDGQPRNAPAAHVHSYLGREGAPPAALLEDAREEVRSYGGEVIAGRALHASRDGEHFRVELTGGHVLVARRLLVATGLVDLLPDIEGLAERWGDDVVHCPFCHGYEVRDRRLVQVLTDPLGLHPARLWRHLTTRLTVVVATDVAVAGADLQELRSAGVEVVDGDVRRVVSGADGHLAAVELADGRRIEADAVAVAPRFAVRAEPFAPLGLVPGPHPSGSGDHVAVDGLGQTAVPGVYAAGNVTDPSLQVLAAAAAGSWVGAMISFGLAEEDLVAAARPSANEADWDHRYGGDRMWSGNPNGTLVAEAGGMAPGRALDVGAGEGGDARWLAAQGWKVTASDVSRRALDRVAAGAEEGGVAVDLLHADANGLHPFGEATYDLVSAQYASIPRTPDGRGVANLLGAVAPGGTLVVVGHDLEPMRAPIDPAEQSRAFDPDAYVRVTDVASALADAGEWDIEVNERRPRPPGAASTHHVDDVVLRARRRP